MVAKPSERLEPIYGATCPNCGGPVSASRLAAGLVCDNCISDNALPELADETHLDYYERVKYIGRRLAETGKLKGYSLLYTSVLEIDDFQDFFSKVTGSKLWSAQLTWAKRLLQEESLAIVAPTGVGKTTLLSIYALYRAKEGARIYYVLPTENLARQVERKLIDFAARAGIDLRIVAYYSGMPKKAREQALTRIANSDYDVLVTTTSFLSRRWSLLEGRRFDVIIVDDVDAVLRNSKNIDKLLYLLGFDEETVEKAHILVKKKIAAIIAKATGNIKRYEKLLEEIKSLEAFISNKLLSVLPGQLVIASATGRTYGLKPKVFRELLGFEIGRVYDYTRSIRNFYKVTDKPLEDAVEIVRLLGDGGLVFVSKRYGKDAAKRLARMLEKSGLKVGLALAGRKVLDRFAKGEYEVLVGVASYYGVIVRGVDMPKRVLYTVFVGVPGTTMEAEKALSSPYRIMRTGLELGLLEERDPLVRLVSRLSPGEATALRIALQRGDSLEGRLGEILEQLLQLRRKIVRVLEERLCAASEALEAGGLIFRCIGGTLVAESIDAATYVQASGRASRMLGSRMTHGVSVVVDESALHVKALEKRLKRFVEDSSFKLLDWEALREEIERAQLSRVDPESAKKVDIETSLIIVESPTKARTIASFFGRPVRRRLGSLLVYETTFYNEVSGKIHVATITASIGHVYDLSLDDEGIYGVILEDGRVRPVYKFIKRCLNCGHQFSSDMGQCPRCGSSNVASKEDVIASLRQLAMENEVVYIATDPDIEGEKIAYDLYLAIKPYARKVLRVEMHAITRREFMNALASPRDINKRLADAQMLRRIEDRWIGFGLSQRLWQVFGRNWLGAGRVQTPVLGWIIDRYEAWRSSLGYNVYVKIDDGLRVKFHYDSKPAAMEAAAVAEQKGVAVRHVEYTSRIVNPPPPFTTETLLYEASRRYGYPAQKTMRIAQELFEAGLITYHRTDSTYVSAEGINVAKQYLAKQGKEPLFQPRHWGTPGHHEAIRPTRPMDADTLRRMIVSGEIRVTITMRESHYRLYDLIFRRFVASQMRPAKILYARLALVLEEASRELEVPVAIEEGGWTEIQPIKLASRLKDLAGPTMLEPLDIRVARGSTIQLYTHGDVVAEMKQRGLGRPSTYAKIIDSIRRHGYVVESKYRKKLVPTKLGKEVYSYLSDNYGDLVSEDRTRKLLEEIEAVANGQADPAQLVNELLTELEELLRERHVLAASGTPHTPTAAGVKS